MDALVYSRILEYLDVIPVDKLSEKEYESQHHWLKRLQTVNKDFTQADDVNFKAIYIMLALNGFDLDRTFIKACQQDLTEISMYLADHTSSTAREQCIEGTTSTAIVNKVELNELQIPRVLVSIRHNTATVSAVLAKVNYLTLSMGTLDEYSTLINSPSSSIVAKLIDDELMNIIGHLADKASATIFDRRGYVYPIDTAIKLDLPISVQTWIDSMQSQTNIRSKLILAVQLDSSVGQILFHQLNVNINEKHRSLIDLAVKSNNYHILQLLPYTVADLSLAISLGNVRAVEAMLSVATRQHLSQAIKQRMNDIRRIINLYLASD